MGAKMGHDGGRNGVPHARFSYPTCGTSQANSAAFWGWSWVLLFHALAIGGVVSARDGQIIIVAHCPP